MLKNFTKEHPDLWQFIMFNLLSNISTITRFVLTWVGTALFVSAMQLTSPFKLAIFDYTTEGSHGLGGFLTFLVGYVTNFCINTLGLGSGLAATIASVVNTLLAVVVSFPLLKFWIMPSDKPKQ